MSDNTAQRDELAAEPFPVGSLLRVTETHTMDGEVIHAGSEFVVEEFVPAGDPEEDYLPYDWYMGNADGGFNNREAAADKVELVKSAAQMHARRIPTTEAIIRELDCLDDYEGFQIDAADSPDGASREISGRTDDGLLFACTITVSNVYQADF